MIGTLALAFLLCALSCNAFSPSQKNNKIRVLSKLSMVNVGEAAPDFELKNYLGKSFKLSSFKGKKPVVVFFYPADNTPGCTTEVPILLRKVHIESELVAIYCRCVLLRSEHQISRNMALKYLAFHQEESLTRRNSSRRTK